MCEAAVRTKYYGVPLNPVQRYEGAGGYNVQQSTTNIGCEDLGPRTPETAAATFFVDDLLQDVCFRTKVLLPD